MLSGQEFNLSSAMKLLSLLPLMAGLCSASMPESPPPVKVIRTACSLNFHREETRHPLQISLTLELQGKGSLFAQMYSVNNEPPELTVVDTPNQIMQEHLGEDRAHLLHLPDSKDEILYPSMDIKKISCVLRLDKLPAPSATGIRIKGILHLLYSPERQRSLSEQTIIPTQEPQTFFMSLPPEWEGSGDIADSTETTLQMTVKLTPDEQHDHAAPAMKDLLLDIEALFPKGFNPETIFPCTPDGDHMHEACLVTNYYSGGPVNNTTDLYKRRLAFTRIQGLHPYYRFPKPHPEGWQNLPMKLAVQYRKPPVSLSVPINLLITPPQTPLATPNSSGLRSSLRPREQSSFTLSTLSWEDHHPDGTSNSLSLLLSHKAIPYPLIIVPFRPFLTSLEHQAFLNTPLDGTEGVLLKASGMAISPNTAHLQFSGSQAAFPSSSTGWQISGMVKIPVADCRHETGTLPLPCHRGASIHFPAQPDSPSPIKVQILEEGPFQDNYRIRFRITGNRNILLDTLNLNPGAPLGLSGTTQECFICGPGEFIMTIDYPERPENLTCSVFYFQGVRMLPRPLHLRFGLGGVY